MAQRLALAAKKRPAVVMPVMVVSGSAWYGRRTRGRSEEIAKIATGEREVLRASPLGSHRLLSNRLICALYLWGEAWLPPSSPRSLPCRWPCAPWFARDLMPFGLCTPEPSLSIKCTDK